MKPIHMQIYQVDAFTDTLFHGNPAAVIPLAAWLPDELLQQIAMENNLAETAYIVPQGDRGDIPQGDQGDIPQGESGEVPQGESREVLRGGAAGGEYQIRWFTPTVEVALCGHATLASGLVVFDHLGFKGDTIVFYSRESGILKVSRQGGGVGRKLTLDFPANPPALTDPVPLIFEGLQIPPAPLYRGAHDYMVVLDNQQQIEALQPDMRKLSGADSRGIVVTAPGDEVDFVSRCFFPQSGIEEDPVTGSAHTMMAPYWATRLGKTSFSAIQLSRRRGHLDCVLEGDRVYISGHAKIFLKGEIFIPEPSISGGEISIKAAQQMVDAWINTTGVRYFSELTNMAILTEEVGEVARLMSRLYGDQSFKESDKGRELADELADLLWVVICIANQTGVDLTSALLKNFEKKDIRDGQRHRDNEKLK